MTEQIRYVLWKLLIVTAIFVVFSVFIDDMRKDIFAAEVIVSDDKQQNDKPIYRCPKKLFALARAGCHQVRTDIDKKGISINDASETTPKNGD